MRAPLAVMIVMAACGDSAAPGGSAASGSAEIEADRPELPDVPRVTDAGATASLLAIRHPAAIVWIEPGHKLFLGHTGKAWKGELPAKRDPIPVDGVMRAVLNAIVTDNGPMASEAKFALKFHPATPPAPDRDDEPDDTVEVAGTRTGRAGTVQLTPAPILSGTAPLVIAKPTVPAHQVVKVLVNAGGSLAVRHGDQLRVLATGFDTRPLRDDQVEWIEVHVDTKGIHVLEPGGQPSTVPAAGLPAAIKKLGSDLPVDVLVSEGANTQQLVDLLLTFKRTQEVSIGLLADNSVVRANRLDSQVSIGTGLERPAVRRRIRQHQATIRACYETELQTKPEILGTVQATFFVGPAGKVTTANATGVDPVVSKCVADALKAIEFPKPTSGLPVQVNYPFIFQPPP